MVLENLLNPLTLILAAILVLLTTKYYFGKRRLFKLGSKLPGPKGWPLLGMAWEIFGCDYDILPLANQYHKTYDFFAFWTGHQLSIVVKSPKDAETHCNSYKLIHRGEKLKYFNPFMGKGLLFAGGEEWKKAKKVMQSAFPYSVLKHFLKVTKNETNILLHRLENEEGKKNFLAFPYIKDCTFDIICSGAFELELKAQRNEAENIIKSIEQIKILAIKRMFSPWQQPDFLYKFFKDGKMFFKNFDAVYKFLNDLTEKKRKFLQEEKTTGKGKDSHGVVLLWEKLLQNENLSQEELRHHIFTTISTGYETTANTICFILTLLGLHPNVQEKAFDELISVVNQGVIDDEKLPKLEYLERVIYETLRLFPTVPLNSRKCTEDIRFGEYLVPEGSDVHLNVFALHRDPSQFENPNEFNPDNFLPENVSKRHPYSFIPFSMGPRKCIGIKIAMMTMKIIVGTILINYKIECDYKSLDEIPFRNEITIRMTNDCPIRLLKR